jgi:hypothetical protein
VPGLWDSRWRFAQATYIRALLEQGEEDLAEDKGVERVSCASWCLAPLRNTLTGAGNTRERLLELAPSRRLSPRTCRTPKMIKEEE